MDLMNGVDNKAILLLVYFPVLDMYCCLANLVNGVDTSITAILQNLDPQYHHRYFSTQQVAQGLI